MTSIRAPFEITKERRFQDIARLLAIAILRMHPYPEFVDSSKTEQKKLPTCLDDSPDLRLTVTTGEETQRPIKQGESA